MKQILEALTGHNISPTEANSRAYMPRSALNSLENGHLHEVGMHNTSKMEDVGIHDEIRIPRPRNHQLGRYLSKGYKPFIDILSCKYFLIRKQEPSVLLYNPKNKDFEQVRPEELFFED